MPCNLTASHIISYHPTSISFHVVTYHTIQYHIKSYHVKCVPCVLNISSWWFRPNWKILVKTQVGMKIKNVWNHHPDKIAMFGFRGSFPCQKLPHRVTPAISTVSPKAERKKGAQVLPRSVCWSEGVKWVQLTIQSVRNYILYIYICTNTTIIRINSWETNQSPTSGMFKRLTEIPTAKVKPMFNGSWWAKTTSSFSEM